MSLEDSGNSVVDTEVNEGDTEEYLYKTYIEDFKSIERGDFFDTFQFEAIADFFDFILDLLRNMKTKRDFCFRYYYSVGKALATSSERESFQKYSKIFIKDLLKIVIDKAIKYVRENEESISDDFLLSLRDFARRTFQNDSLGSPVYKEDMIYIEVLLLKREKDLPELSKEEKYEVFKALKFLQYIFEFDFPLLADSFKDLDAAIATIEKHRLSIYSDKMLVDLFKKIPREVVFYIYTENFDDLLSYLHEVIEIKIGKSEVLLSVLKVIKKGDKPGKLELEEPKGGWDCVLSLRNGKIISKSLESLGVTQEGLPKSTSTDNSFVRIVSDEFYASRTADEKFEDILEEIA